jgi:hypothetical protein
MHSHSFGWRKIDRKSDLTGSIEKEPLRVFSQPALGTQQLLD